MTYHIMLETKYGKDVADLITKIDTFLERRFKSHSFEGNYAECSKFAMTPIGDIGAFLVKFPDAPFVAVAAIDLNSGDYFFKSETIGDKTLNIYALDGLDVTRIVSMAESEWSIETNA